MDGAGHTLSQQVESIATTVAVVVERDPRPGRLKTLRRLEVNSKGLTPLTEQLVRAV